jgi:biopolymer transport protein ExbD
MAMGTGGGTNAVQSSPNVTPMIDVMLVLLIIFMVVTPQLLAGFTAEPPHAINLKDHPEDPENDHVFGIDAGGRYYLDKKLYDEAAIAPQIKEWYTAPGREDFVMYLRAHGDLPYSKVQDAMEIAMKNGVRVMGLIGEQKPGTQSTVSGDNVKPPSED